MCVSSGLTDHLACSPGFLHPRARERNRGHERGRKGDVEEEGGRRGGRGEEGEGELGEGEGGRGEGKGGRGGEGRNRAPEVGAGVSGRTELCFGGERGGVGGRWGGGGGGGRRGGRGRGRGAGVAQEPELGWRGLVSPGRTGLCFGEEGGEGDVGGGGGGGRGSGGGGWCLREDRALHWVQDPQVCGSAAGPVTGRAGGEACRWPSGGSAVAVLVPTGAPMNLGQPCDSRSGARRVRARHQHPCAGAP